MNAGPTPARGRAGRAKGATATYVPMTLVTASDTEGDVRSVQSTVIAPSSELLMDAAYAAVAAKEQSTRLTATMQTAALITDGANRMCRRAYTVLHANFLQCRWLHCRMGAVPQSARRLAKRQPPPPGESSRRTSTATAATASPLGGVTSY